MSAGIILLFMLAAVFAMAGMHHLLIWARNVVAREYLWFGIASWAAAGAATACGLATLDSATSALAQRAFAVCSVAWLAATAWFSVELAAGDYRRRRAAFVVTLLLTISLLRDFFAPTTGHYVFPAATLSRPLFLDIVTLAILIGLVIDGAMRLWSSALRFRSVALALGVGLVLLAAGLQEFLPDPGPFPLGLYAFLITVAMMTYDLAEAVANGRGGSQRQRQELAHASRLSIVGELTASIAHEINQPLGAILSNADAGEILLDGSDPPLDEIKQILSDIRRDGLRASDVIRHVRTLVRKRELELEKLDANAVVADVIALLEPEAHRRRIPIASALAPQPANFRGDRAHMEQVLINLMLNAMDAVDAAADGATALRQPVVLSVSSTSYDEVEFRITDNGSGIPVEHLGQLFDSFYTSKPHGMGLGLSIARSIVEAHGGRIRAENNRDSGATFTITLPPFVEES